MMGGMGMEEELAAGGCALLMAAYDVVKHRQGHGQAELGLGKHSSKKNCTSRAKWRRKSNK